MGRSQSTPAVSVAIPAYKAAHLAQAIDSVLAQTFGDFELLISDDCPDDRVKAVAARFTDPRIRLIEGPRRGLVANSVRLWDAAGADLLKFVYDDDFLYPEALAELSAQLQRDPAFNFAFCRRHIVDAAGQVTSAPLGFPGDQAMAFDAGAIAANIARRLRNPVGEPSNLLIRRSAFPDASCLSRYCGQPIRHLIDVAFFMNASPRGPCVGVPAFLSAFRVHAEQATSRRAGREFSAQWFEWELFSRGAVASGVLPPAEALEGLPRLEEGYLAFAGDFPEIRPFRDALPDLRRRLAAGETEVLDAPFLANLARAHTTIDARSA